ncbi:hypothetical protein NEF87_003581 [Candidatus Lokiarchaeum ossiferum]|uniref:OST3 / OST6 family protein n=1 Tax=Candidatus Lokiarchaeum ossiferum TaxID=2951803 RepID=A0ABY6HXK4_9ARCH|nr:hypothetical protein NEF87_003581 [Candidatus Lokiarchaeum sp. B-35]
MSEKLQDKFGKKMPWVMGNQVRIPRIKYPTYREGSLSLPSPGRSMMLLGTFIFLFWLLMGGIYILIKEPSAMGGNASGAIMWLYPSTSDAFVIESIVAAVLIFIGGSGFFLLYNATKHSFNYNYAIKLLILGMVLAGTSFGILQYMMAVKTGKIIVS